MKTAAVLLSLAAAGMAVPALAQTAPGAGPMPGRYQFQPVEGGLAKLDTATGEITICRLDPARMVCDPASSAPPDAASAPLRPPVADREDEDFDKSLDRMKRVFRAFGDVAREFDGTRPAQATPEPNRT